MKISNCHIWAWKQFVDKGGHICFQMTEYAKYRRNETEWYWLPFVWLGIFLQHLGSWITFVGWILRWRAWYHVVWVSDTGEKWEFVPVKEKVNRKVAFVIFNGKVQKVKDD